MPILNKVSIWKYLLILIGFCAVGFISFYVGATFQRQTLYQSYGFNVERSLTVLEYISKGDIQGAKTSLEISLEVGVALGN